MSPFFLCRYMHVSIYTHTCTHTHIRLCWGNTLEENIQISNVISQGLAEEWAAAEVNTGQGFRFRISNSTLIVSGSSYTMGSP